MSHRSRWTAGLATATLALSGLAQLGLAGPAAAVAAGPCSSNGVGTVLLDGTPAVGAPVTATVTGNEGRARYAWSGTGLGAPVHGPTFTARPDVVGAPMRLTVQVRGAGGRSFTASCDFDRVGWGHLARPAAPDLTGSPVLGGTLRASSATDLPAGARIHYELVRRRQPECVRDRRGARPAPRPGRQHHHGQGDGDGGRPSRLGVVGCHGDPRGRRAPCPAGCAVHRRDRGDGERPDRDPCLGRRRPRGRDVRIPLLADGEQFATGSAVTLAAGQVGHAITVQDRATATGYAASEWSASSSATTSVTPGDLDTPSDVTLSGTPVVGSTLTAVVTGGWTPGTQVAFTWKADGVAFATTPGSAVLTTAEAGRMISVEIAGSLAGYVSETVGSPAVGPVDGGSLPATAPSQVSVTGTPKVGRSVTARVTGAWPAGTAVVYVWRANGRPFAGNAATVVLSPSQRGTRITVTVTGSLAGYRPASVGSAPSATVAAGTLTAPRPTVSGKAKVGRTLRVSTGRWTPATRLSVRWYADGRLIKGATSRHLRLTRKLRAPPDHRRRHRSPDRLRHRDPDQQADRPDHLGARGRRHPLGLLAVLTLDGVQHVPHPDERGLRGGEADVVLGGGGERRGHHHVADVAAGELDRAGQPVEVDRVVGVERRHLTQVDVPEPPAGVRRPGRGSGR